MFSSEEERRKVPIPAILRDYLVKQRMRSGRRGRALIFGNTPETPFTANMLQRRAERALKEAGLERITPHACRHTFASLMIAAGVNAKALSTFMGHANISDHAGPLRPPDARFRGRSGRRCSTSTWTRSANERRIRRGVPPSRYSRFAWKAAVLRL